MWSVVFCQGTPKYNQKIKNNPNISDVAVCGKSCCIYIYCFVCRDFLWTKLSSISWRLRGRAKSSAIFGREQFHQVWSIYRQEYPTWSDTFERKFRSSPTTDFSRLVKRRDFRILRSPFQGRRVPEIPGQSLGARYHWQVSLSFACVTDFPAVFFLALSWNTNENPSAFKLSRAINKCQCK